MHISAKTKIHDLVESYPFLVDFLPEINQKFKLLKNPVMRNTVGKVATLTQVASIGGMSVDELINKIADEIFRRTGTRPEVDIKSSEATPIKEATAKHEMLKTIIKSLHEGGDFNEAKRQFTELIKDVNASEIAAMEQRLMDEGMPQEEVKRLCDVHVQVFRETIEEKEVPTVPEGHPVYTFMVENRALEKLIDRIKEVIRAIGTPASQEMYQKYRVNLTKQIESFQKIHLHYLRKENQLFPILERHEITGPSQVMWSLDDDIRGMVKKCAALHQSNNLAELLPALDQTIQALIDMIYKEEHILFPLAIETLSSDEWSLVKKGEEEIGFAWILPIEKQPESPVEQQLQPIIPGTIQLDTGSLTAEQINLMLLNLPVDISFVDEKDEVRYYSATRDRIFPRSAGVIGRKVQNCHPPKSLHVVQNILNDFREGKRDVAEFWIEMHGKFIHIRYFALRNEHAEYKGCLEVSQDVTGIRALQGEKRLLE